jgi:hypothetical protein
VLNDLLSRVWDDITGRMSGPLHTRFFIQPAMAASAALRARRTPTRRYGKDIALVCAMAFALDVLYQFLMFHWFYPGEAVLISVLLALVPYAFIRGAMRHGR